MMSMLKSLGFAKRAVLFLSLGAAVVFAVAVVYTRSAEAQAQSRRGEQMRAFTEGGLRAAAAVTGRYNADAVTNEGAPLSLHQLTAFSHLVVTGIAESNLSRLSADGKTIFTDYEVRIEHTLKGQNVSSGVVRVVVPGGRVSFPDGSMAQVNSPGFLKPQPRQRYVWFLRPARSSRVGAEGSAGRMFEASFGPLGIYDISEDSTIIAPRGMQDYTFARELAKERVRADVFLQRVRTEIGR
jgi:hypothetical protein